MSGFKSDVKRFMEVTGLQDYDEAASIYEKAVANGKRNARRMKGTVSIKVATDDTPFYFDSLVNNGFEPTIVHPPDKIVDYLNHSFSDGEMLFNNTRFRMLVSPKFEITLNGTDSTIVFDPLKKMWYYVKD